MKTLRISKNNTVILRTLVLSFFILGLLVSLSAKSIAGSPQNESAHRIALSVNDSDNYLFTSGNLDRIRAIGVDMLELPFPNSISSTDVEQFYLLLDSNQHYVTEYQVRNNHKLILNSVLRSYNSVPAQLMDNVAAIKLFDYPADYRSDFPSSADSLLIQLSNSFDKPIYYQSAFSTPDYPLQKIDFFSSQIKVRQDGLTPLSSTVIKFEPSTDENASLQRLEECLNQLLTESESLIIIPADWFLKRIEAQSSFSTIISAYLDGEPVNFPMPAETANPPETNWPIILLLILWISFILHYNYQPMYKAALPRYFLNHSFFVQDVKQYRIRNATPGVIILLQHAVITGLFFYLLSEDFISNRGLESFSYHYSVIFYPGFEKLSLFGIGFLTALISHIISIFWIYLPNKQIKQLNQVINLYSWPFHINLIVVTFAVYFVQLQSAEDWTLAAAVIFFFFWFSSFIIAASDSARFLQKYRALNLFLTVGLYFLVISLSIVLALWLPRIYQPIEMAFMLP